MTSSAFRTRGRKGHAIFSILFCALAIFWGTAESSAIDIDDFASAENDRFANNAAFIMDPFDLSGVGRSSDNKWGTLVSRNVLVSANHFHPADGASITFFETNDPSGNSVTRTVTDGERVGSSDIWIAALDNPVPESYAFFDFATEDINNPIQFNTSVYAGENAYLFGRSPTVFSSATDVAVGRNVLDQWFEDVDSGGTIDDAMGAEKEAESLDVTYEALLESGDSGGPMFVSLNGTDLTLVGINWFVGELQNGNDVSGFSYVGNYDGEIQNFIASHPVPEPATVSLLALGALLLGGWMLGRRRG